MKLTRLFAVTITTVLLVAGGFVAGFLLPDVVTADSSGKLVASLQLLPERIQQLAGPSNRDDQSLPIVDTYWSVLSQLSNNYYGKKIDQREMTYAAVRGMLEALGDPYTRFLAPKDYKDMREQNEGDFVGIGAHLETDPKTHQVYIKKPVDPSPAKEAGLLPHDVIVKVDGKPIAGLDIEVVVKKIRGLEGTKVRLTIQRPKAPKLMEFVITRRVVQIEIVDYRMLDQKQKIGYIQLSGFNEQSDTQLNKALTELEKIGMKALVLDLRDNPGGLLTQAVDVGSRFVDHGPIVIIQERNGKKTPLNVEQDKHNHKRYPLVVLINDHSASASEIVSGAIRDNKAGTLVGTRTYGKGKVQTIVPLSDGSAVSITTAKYLTPNGTDINNIGTTRVGIKPDVELENPDPNDPKYDKVKFDPEDPKNDLQLIRAQEILKEKLKLASARSDLTWGSGRSSE